MDMLEKKKDSDSESEETSLAYVDLWMGQSSEPRELLLYNLWPKMA